MNEYNISVLGKIFTAVESGGQIYGKGRWDDVTLPHFGNEKTLTLGAYQFGGGSNEGRDLLRLIRERYHETFAKYDTCGIAATLDIDWYLTGFIGSEAQRAAIKAMIAAPDGITCQTIMFGEVQLPTYLKHAYAYGIPAENIPALMMWAEIDHLGGSKAPVRVFNRCNGDFTVDKILSALLPKHADYTKYKCPVEDSIFWTRHVKCSEFVMQYAQYPEEDAENKNEEKEDKQELTAKERAKILLRQQNLKVMTGYTPEGAQCFKDAGAWTKTPIKGAIVYFWGKPAGEKKYRICHTGIVKSVNTSGKTFRTDEGNSSSSSWTTNGGCVAEHEYSYANVGGDNRVNGFGIPDFEGAGITADEFVAMADYYLGYEEKRSDANLDSFHANAGSNNHQKFERDVIGCSGDQWCQYYVDAIAIYTCEGKKAETTGMTGGIQVTVRELSKGSKGSDVKTVQILLIHKFGISCGSSGADGDFGDATDSAVKKFQEIKGLDADGCIGPLTWAALVA